MKNALINLFYYWAGIVFLLLSRVKSFIQGYSAPKPFGINEFQRSVEYDINVVDKWISILLEYEKADKETILKNRSVLELGPGSDLGVGLYLLSKSIKKYIAVDVNNLIKDVPEQFYNIFFKYLKENLKLDVSVLMEELKKTKDGNNDKLDYICRKDFNIVKALGSRKVDIVFSQAAFEHFDDIDETIKEVSDITRPGATFISLVDLKTHSRWIRNKDPNNIYRYSKWVYHLFSSRGTPNRVRPYQYKQALEKNGWENIVIKPSTILKNNKYNSIIRYLDSEFAEDKNQMNYLGIWICAKKHNA